MNDYNINENMEMNKNNNPNIDNNNNIKKNIDLWPEHLNNL